MPGTQGAPFFGHTTIFNDQPTIAAFISTNTAQAIPSGVPTTLTFVNPINIDPLGTNAWRSLWALTVPGRFTITVRGWYAFGAAVAIEAITANRLALYSIVNGVISAQQEISRPAAAGAFLSVHQIYPLVNNATVQFGVYQDSGGPLSVVDSLERPMMWIARIG